MQSESNIRVASSFRRAAKQEMRQANAVEWLQAIGLHSRTNIPHNSGADNQSSIGTDLAILIWQRQDSVCLHPGYN